MAPLNPVLDPKPSEEEGKALVTHGEYQQELEESKIEVALLRMMKLKRRLT